MTVLITGADGFIGSHRTEASVRAFAQHNSFNSWGCLGHCVYVICQVENFSGYIRNCYVAYGLKVKYGV